MSASRSRRNESMRVTPYSAADLKFESSSRWHSTDAILAKQPIHTDQAFGGVPLDLTIGQVSTAASSRGARLHGESSLKSSFISITSDVIEEIPPHILRRERGPSLAWWSKYCEILDEQRVHDISTENAATTRRISPSSQRHSHGHQRHCRRCARKKKSNHAIDSGRDQRQQCLIDEPTPFYLGSSVDGGFSAGLYAVDSLGPLQLCVEKHSESARRAKRCRLLESDIEVIESESKMLRYLDCASVSFICARSSLAAERGERKMRHALWESTGSKDVEEVIKIERGSHHVEWRIELGSRSSVVQVRSRVRAALKDPKSRLCNALYTDSYADKQNEIQIEIQWPLLRIITKLQYHFGTVFLEGELNKIVLAINLSLDAYDAAWQEVGGDALMDRVEMLQDREATNLKQGAMDVATLMCDAATAQRKLKKKLLSSWIAKSSQQQEGMRWKETQMNDTKVIRQDDERRKWKSDRNDPIPYGEWMDPGTKQEEDVAGKATRVNAELLDYSSLTDISCVRISFASVDDLLTAAAWIQKQLANSIAWLDNRLARPTVLGYRDIRIGIEQLVHESGRHHFSELQLVLDPLFKVKQGIGHEYYQFIRETLSQRVCYEKQNRMVEFVFDQLGSTKGREDAERQKRSSKLQQMREELDSLKSNLRIETLPAENESDSETLGFSQASDPESDQPCTDILVEADNIKRLALSRAAETSDSSDVFQRPLISTRRLHDEFEQRSPFSSLPEVPVSRSLGDLLPSLDSSPNVSDASEYEELVEDSQSNHDHGSEQCQNLHPIALGTSSRLEALKSRIRNKDAEDVDCINRVGGATSGGVASIDEAKSGWRAADGHCGPRLHSITLRRREQASCGQTLQSQVLQCLSHAASNESLERSLQNVTGTAVGKAQDLGVIAASTRHDKPPPAFWDT